MVRHSLPHTTCYRRTWVIFNCVYMCLNSVTYLFWKKYIYFLKIGRSNLSQFSLLCFGRDGRITIRNHFMRNGILNTFGEGHAKGREGMEIELHSHLANYFEFHPEEMYVSLSLLALLLSLSVCLYLSPLSLFSFSLDLWFIILPRTILSRVLENIFETTRTSELALLCFDNF